MRLSVVWRRVWIALLVVLMTAVGIPVHGRAQDLVPTILWQVQLDVGMFADESDTDTIYVIDKSSVRAITAATGEQRWATPQEHDGFTGCWHRIVGNHLLLEEGGGVLVSLSTATGEVEWTQGNTLSVSCLTVGEKTVYVDVADGCVGFNVDTGQQDFATAFRCDWMALDQGGVVVVAGYPDNDSAVHGIDPASGNEIWRHELASDVKSLIPINGQLVVLDESKITAVDTQTGKTLWALDLGPGAIVEEKALAGTVLVVRDNNFALRALDLTRGTVAWSSGGFYIETAMPDRILLRGANADNEGLWMLDAATGNVLWSRPNSEEQGYWDSEDHNLYADSQDPNKDRIEKVDPDTGRTIWAYDGLAYRETVGNIVVASGGAYIMGIDLAAPGPCPAVAGSFASELVSGGTAVVVTDQTVLRAAPSLEGLVVAELAQCTVVQLVAPEEVDSTTWWKVMSPSGDGYVEESALSPVSSG